MISQRPNVFCTVLYPVYDQSETSTYPSPRHCIVRVHLPSWASFGQRFFLSGVRPGTAAAQIREVSPVGCGKIPAKITARHVAVQALGSYRPELAVVADTYCAFPPQREAFRRRRHYKSAAVLLFARIMHEL